MAGGEPGPGSEAAAGAEAGRPDLAGLIEVTVAAHDPAAAVVTVAGEVDLLTAPLVREKTCAVLEARPLLLVLDLRAITFFDSSGLAVLLEIARTAAGQGTTLRLACDTAPVLRPLQATGLTGEFEIYRSPKEALA